MPSQGRISQRENNNGMYVCAVDVNLSTNADMNAVFLEVNRTNMTTALNVAANGYKTHLFLVSQWAAMTPACLL